MNTFDASSFNFGLSNYQPNLFGDIQSPQSQLGLGGGGSNMTMQDGINAFPEALQRQRQSRINEYMRSRGAYEQNARTARAWLNDPNTPMLNPSNGQMTTAEDRFANQLNPRDPVVYQQLRTQDPTRPDLNDDPANLRGLTQYEAPKNRTQAQPQAASDPLYEEYAKQWKYFPGQQSNSSGETGGTHGNGGSDPSGGYGDGSESSW